MRIEYVRFIFQFYRSDSGEVAEVRGGQVRRRHFQFYRSDSSTIIKSFWEKDIPKTFNSIDQIPGSGKSMAAKVYMKLSILSIRFTPY